MHSPSLAHLRDEPRASRQPPLRSPLWPELCAPVARFCATLTGRTWPELHAFAEREGMGLGEVVNRVAWLEEHGRLRSLHTGGAVRWVATGDETTNERTSHV